MEISYGTHIGMVRSNNQDSVFVRQISQDSGLFIVADGMGGHRGGKTASTLAAEQFNKYFEENYDEAMNSPAIERLMHMAVDSANKEVFEKAQKDSELSGMGTTLVAMFIRNNTLHTVSVGDSRAYVYSNNRMYQITSDHSLVGDLLTRGLITEEEAKTHPQKNVITRAVGSEVYVKADYFETSLSSGEILIGCSDGLHTMLSDREIASCVSDGVEGAADKLIALANEKGGNDNITVVAVKIS